MGFDLINGKRDLENYDFSIEIDKHNAIFRVKADTNGGLFQVKKSKHRYHSNDLFFINMLKAPMSGYCNRIEYKIDDEGLFYVKCRDGKHYAKVELYGVINQRNTFKYSIQKNETQLLTNIGLTDTMDDILEELYIYADDIEWL